MAALLIEPEVFTSPSMKSSDNETDLSSVPSTDGDSVETFAAISNVNSFMDNFCSCGNEDVLDEKLYMTRSYYVKGGKMRRMNSEKNEYLTKFIKENSVKTPCKERVLETKPSTTSQRTLGSISVNRLYNVVQKMKKGKKKKPQSSRR